MHLTKKVLIVTIFTLVLAQFVLAQQPVGIPQLVTTDVVPHGTGRIASPRTVLTSDEYFIPYFRSSDASLVIYGLGLNGLFGDADDTGIKVVQSPMLPWVLHINVPPQAHGADLAFISVNIAFPPYQSIFVTSAGVDRYLGTSDDITNYAVYTGDTGVEYVHNLVPSGLLFSYITASTRYVIRQHPGPDGVFHSPFLPPTDDYLESVGPTLLSASTPIVNYKLATSNGKTTSWNDIDAQSNTITKLLAPGPNGLLGDTDDEGPHIFGGSGVSEVGRVNYDGSLMVAMLNYAGTSSVRLYDLRPIGPNIPLGINGPAGRLPSPPTPQAIALPLPPGAQPATLQVLDFDVDGLFADAQSNFIAGSIAVLYRVNLTEGGSVTAILFTHPGYGMANPFNDGDDLTKVIFFPGTTLNSIPYNTFYVKETYISFLGRYNGVFGLYHLRLQ